MRRALEQVNVTFDDLSVVDETDTVERVADCLAVIVPIARLQTFGRVFGESFDGDFNRDGQGCLPVHCNFGVKSDGVFEFGIPQVVVSPLPVGHYSLERDRHHRDAELNRRHARQLQVVDLKVHQCFDLLI